MNTTKFILIDDDLMILTFCRMLIKKIFGAVDVKAFSSAIVGLEYLRSEFSNFSEETSVVLLLDINMPDMDGWEFLEHFEKLDEEIQNNISIFILSSSVDDRDKERASSNKHVVAYLVKPLTKDAIIHISMNSEMNSFNKQVNLLN